MSRPLLSVDEYVRGVLAADRGVLGRTITLVESRHQADLEVAQEVLQRLLPQTGKGHRVGITGPPGVGKSTFIETLGSYLTGSEHRVAVLAVDPSSRRSGGSILGDKTRMPKLSVDPNAFIRPSPTSGTLGGVARATREAILVCEAAGFNVVLVETVGAGQSESEVAEMVDFFLVLALPGAGDDLQGIKKGVLELADLIAVNKADGDNLSRARHAAADFGSALRILEPGSQLWKPSVLMCSALENRGLDEIWKRVEEHRELMKESGALKRKRRQQRVRWMWALVEQELVADVRRDPQVKAELPQIQSDLLGGHITPAAAASKVLASLRTGGIQTRKSDADSS